MLTSPMDESSTQEEPMSTVISRSPTELRDEREMLLHRAGLAEDDLRRRAENYQLSAQQMDILDAIDNIDYLLEDS